MKALEKDDKVAPNFNTAVFERLHPLWEAHDTLCSHLVCYESRIPHTRRFGPKANDDLRCGRLLPCFMAMMNTGYQANAAIFAGASPIDDWHV